MIDLLIRRRETVRSSLPYDAEVLYLESTGTQWIDTNVSESVSSLIFEIKAQFNTPSSGYYACGFTTTSAQQAFYGLNSGSAGLYASFCSNSSNIQKTLSSNKDTWHTFKCVIENGTTQYYFDGEYKSSHNTSNFSIGNFYLFACASTGAAQGKVNGRIASASLTINGIEKFNFIPVRKGQVGYMYDRVSGELFGNAGTGSFVLGSDVDHYDSQIEYLECNDRQSWIDTGIYIAPTYSIHCDFLFNTNGNYAFYGASNGGSATTGEIAWFCNKTNHDVVRPTSNSASAVDKVTVSQNVRHSTIYKSGSINVDGVVTTKTAWYDSYVSVRTLFLFGTHRTTPYVGGEHIRIYSFKIMNGESTVIDLIPVRVGTIGYMFDKVSRKLLFNLGSGTFLLGNDIN